MNIGGNEMNITVLEKEILKKHIKHDLKLSSQYYDDVIMERKKFELRVNDRDY